MIDPMFSFALFLLIFWTDDDPQASFSLLPSGSPLSDVGRTAGWMPSKKDERPFF